MPFKIHPSLELYPPLRKRRLVWFPLPKKVFLTMLLSSKSRIFHPIWNTNHALPCFWSKDPENRWGFPLQIASPSKLATPPINKVLILFFIFLPLTKNMKKRRLVVSIKHLTLDFCLQLISSLNTISWKRNFIEWKKIRGDSPKGEESTKYYRWWNWTE